MSQRVNPPEVPSPDLGKSLRGQLEQIKLIATGGMAHVFRAYQPSLGRSIVVKRLKDDLLASPETCERFRREARALASVLHQNIAHVYDYVEGPGEAFILMEYIDGIDLSTALEKLGHLPPPIAAAILLGVARGLNQIHSQGLIHRDIKPSNIRLTSTGGVKLMDFGIVLDFSNTSLTRPGMMVGSPSYLSPEQVLGDVITPQSDIFLLGITFYEMLTGSRPFKAEGGNTVFQQIREASFLPARSMNRKIPQVLDRAVSKCLRLNPESRWDGVRELIGVLERYLGPTISSRPEELVLKFLDDEVLVKAEGPTHSVPLPQSPRFSFLPWAAGATALLLLGLTFWMGRRWEYQAQQEHRAMVQAVESKAKSPSSTRRAK